MQLYPTWNWENTQKIRTVFREINPQLQIQVICQTSEETCKKISKQHLFVHFSKAFDSVHRKKLEQVLWAYGLPKETATAIMIKARIPSLDGDTNFFNNVMSLSFTRSYIRTIPIICLDYILQTSTALMKENSSTLKKRKKQMISSRNN